ncbi:MAG TPA: DNA-processing protein DprA [Steroidobacteraceae bacterium]|nr:DNA-processing protein DprA [Steroidobacteraceae bacterium]
MEPARLHATLARTPGLTAQHLFACRTGAAAAPPPDLPARLLEGPLPQRARAWLERPDTRLIDADLAWIEATGCRILCCLDPDFPAALLQLAPAPPTLYVSGDPGPLNGPIVTIVGSRRPTAGGMDTARRFAAELARAGVGIASGLAVGIDAAAHEGALSVGLTIGVCATGLDRVYPVSLAPLAERIRGHGSLLSVFAPGAGPRRHHFAIRNRLLGALGAGTLAVEADGGSGSLGTASEARRLERPLFAVPGSIRDPCAHGCNQLIREGAMLVQRSCEILRDLHFPDINQRVTRASVARPEPRPCSSPLDNKYEMLLDAAGFEPVDIDVLAFRTGWSGHAVAAMLLLLELQGRVAPQPGGRYCRLS